MNYLEKIEQLRTIISRKLTPLIPGDSILVDAPYYSNIGDILIWQGEIDFLSTLSGRNLHISSSETFTFPTLPENITILLTGGGNFGDLWRYYHEFRMKVISHYPNNRIVMFPQSVWYDDTTLIATDNKIFSNHTDLHFCARDNWSYNFFLQNFTSLHSDLVPDMAFFIDDSMLTPWREHPLSSRNKNMFLLRKDKELDTSIPYDINRDIYDISDWPTKEREPKRHRWLDKISYITRNRLSSFPFLYNFIEHSVDSIADFAVRQSHLRTGLQFLSPYQNIVTTRLHALILGVLLGKEVEYIDNTTKKLSAFADTWLSDLDSVKPYMSQHLN